MAIENVETPVELTAEAKGAGMKRPKKLVKGSVATKRWMAHLRAMRKSSKKASSPKRGRKASRKGRKASRKGRKVSRKGSKKAAKTPMRRRKMSRKGAKKSAKGSRKARK